MLLRLIVSYSLRYDGSGSVYTSWTILCSKSQYSVRGTFLFEHAMERDPDSKFEEEIQIWKLGKYGLAVVISNEAFMAFTTNISL